MQFENLSIYVFGYPLLDLKSWLDTYQLSLCWKWMVSFIFCVPMKENHCIIWLQLSLCWIVWPGAGITSSFFMCDAIWKLVELFL